MCGVSMQHLKGFFFFLCVVCVWYKPVGVVCVCGICLQRVAVVFFSFFFVGVDLWVWSVMCGVVCVGVCVV